MYTVPSAKFSVTEINSSVSLEGSAKTVYHKMNSLLKLDEKM